MVISASTRTKKTDLMVPFVAPECGRISQMTRQKTEVSLLVRFPNACMTSISAPLQVSRCAARRLINTPISGSLDVFPAESIGRFACRCGIRFDRAPRFLTILTGRNLPKIIRQSMEAEPSTINAKTIADFTRVVEQTGILARDRAPDERLPEK
jgi:hypothetical protein